MGNEDNIKIDQSAVDRIAALRASEAVKEFGAQSYLRVAVESGGCSGFQYKMEADDTLSDDDKLYAESVIIDDVSLQFLKGSTIKFKNDLMGSMFVIDNPNASSSCGCQVSFSVDPSKMA